MRSIRRWAAGLTAVVVIAAWMVVPAAAREVGAVEFTTAADFVLSSSRSRLYLSGGAGTTSIAELDLDGNEVGRIAGVGGAHGLAVSDDGATLWAALSDEGALASINLQTRLVRRIPVSSTPCPKDLTLAGGRVWFAYGCSTTFELASVDPSAIVPAAVRDVAAGSFQSRPPQLEAVASTAAALYVHDGFAGDVFRFDATAPASAPIEGLDGPQFSSDLTIRPDGSSLVLSALGGVFELDADTLEPTTEFDAGEGVRPGAVAVNSTNTRIAAIGSGFNSPNIEIFVDGRTAAVHAWDREGPEANPTPHAVWAPSGDRILFLRRAASNGQVRVGAVDGAAYDPVVLEAHGARTGGGTATVSGALEFTDDTAGTARQVTVSRAGPSGPVVVGTATTAVDGSFSIVDPAPGAAATTYRVSWSGDAHHEGVLALSSIPGSITTVEPPVGATDRRFDLPIGYVADLAVDEVHGRVFLTDGAGSSKLLVRNLDGEPVTTITLLANARGLELTPDQTTLFVAEPAAGTIAVIDTASATVVGRLKATGLGSPWELTLAGTRLFVAETGPGSWVSFDLQRPNDVIDHTWKSGALGPRMLWSPAQPNTLIVASTYGSPTTLYRFDINDGDLEAKDVTPSPGGASNGSDLSFSPDGTRLFLAAGAPYEILELAVDDMSVVRTYDTGPYPNGVEVTAGGTHVAAGVDNSVDPVQVFPVGATVPTRRYTTSSTAPWLDGRTLQFTESGRRLFFASHRDEGRAAELYVKYLPLVPLPCSISPVPLGSVDAGQPVTLRATVRDSAGRPASGVSVRVTRTDPRATVAVSPVLTDVDGQVAVGDIATSAGTSTYSVEATVQAELGTCRAQVSLDVRAVVASAVRDLTATPSSNAIRASWNAPAFDGGLGITGYRVRLAPGGFVQDVPSTQTALDLAGLAPSTAYQVSVAALTGAGLGTPAVRGTTTAPTPTPAPAPSTAPPGPASTRQGYWMVTSDGRVFGFGAARHLGDAPVGPVEAVDLERTPSGDGYWVVDAAGHVFTFGDATYFGGAPALGPGERVTSISTGPTGAGYWLFTTAGRVFARGAVGHLGDMSGVRLNGPILDSIPTPSGNGYYLVGSDGGIFTFGDAEFRGSMGGIPLNAPVQSLVPDPDGSGYWLVASDGGIFAFDATFHGSMGGTRLNRPVTGMVGYRDGYLMVGEDGGIFTFGDAPFHGSLGEAPPNRPVASVAAF